MLSPPCENLLWLMVGASVCAFAIGWACKQATATMKQEEMSRKEKVTPFDDDDEEDDEEDDYERRQRRILRDPENGWRT